MQSADHPPPLVTHFRRLLRFPVGFLWSRQCREAYEPFLRREGESIFEVEGVRRVLRLVELFQLDDAAYHIASNLIDDANKYGGKVTPPPANLIYTFKKRHKYNT